MGKRAARIVSGAEHKLVVGLLGGIGAGKSTVAQFLVERGAAEIDSDRLNSEELAQPEVVQTLVGWWGEEILEDSGGIDRKAVANRVFRSVAERRKLEAFLHPRIGRRRARLLARYQQDPDCLLIVLNSPLLLEGGLDRLCNTLVFVACDRKRRLERVMRTRGWSSQELDRREKLQKPLDWKRDRADHVLENSTSLDGLRNQTHNLFLKLLSRDLEA